MVDADAPGVTRRACRTHDGLRAAVVTFDGVEVGAADAIGEPGEALPIIERVAEAAIAALAAEAVGVMSAALDMTVEYLKTRHQFGGPIGRFQALQHRAAEMLIAHRAGAQHGDVCGADARRAGCGRTAQGAVGGQGAGRQLGALRRPAGDPAARRHRRHRRVRRRPLLQAADDDRKPSSATPTIIWPSSRAPAASSRRRRQRHELRSATRPTKPSATRCARSCASTCRPRWRAATCAASTRRKADMLAWTRILHAQGWSAPHWPVRTRRHRLVAAAAPPVRRGMLAGRRAADLHRRVQPRRAGDLHLRQRRAARALSAADPQRRAVLGAGLLGAERRLGPGVAAHARGARRRRTTSSTARRRGPPRATTPTCCSASCAPIRSAKPQRGISFLLIDAKAPGVTIRPIISIDGAHSLNEVFFDDVRVPVANRVGDEGQGWSCAKFLLENERAFSAEVPRNKRMLARLKAIASAQGLLDEPVFAHRIAEVEVELAALEWLTLRALSEHGSARRRRVAGRLGPACARLRAAAEDRRADGRGARRARRRRLPRAR